MGRMSVRELGREDLSAGPNLAETTPHLIQGWQHFMPSLMLYENTTTYTTLQLKKTKKPFFKNVSSTVSSQSVFL